MDMADLNPYADPTQPEQPTAQADETYDPLRALAAEIDPARGEIFDATHTLLQEITGQTHAEDEMMTWYGLPAASAIFNDITENQ